jgi:hypothetical protein
MQARRSTFLVLVLSEQRTHDVCDPLSTDIFHVNPNKLGYQRGGCLFYAQ